jgi:hypothetical protein
MRFVKQLFYGFLYLAVIGGVALAVSKSGVLIAPTCFDNKLNQNETEIDCGGPNCESCELKHLQPIRAAIQYFPAGSNTNAVIIFANPNLNYGATFSYTLNFYDASRKPVYSLTKEAYIYPAEANHVVVEPNLPFSAGSVVGSPDVLVVNPTWKKAAEFKAPATQLRQIISGVSGTQVTITGIFSNRESFGLSEAGIGALISNKVTKAPLGASKTILQDIQPFEERAFKVLIPISAKLKQSEIDTIIYSQAKK